MTSLHIYTSTSGQYPIDVSQLFPRNNTQQYRATITYISSSISQATANLNSVAISSSSFVPRNKAVSSTQPRSVPILLTEQNSCGNVAQSLSSTNITLKGESEFEFNCYKDTLTMDIAFSSAVDGSQVINDTGIPTGVLSMHFTPI